MNTYKAIVDTSESMKGDLSVACLICNEPVLLNDMEKSRLNHGLDIHSKICDKCKKAILYWRKELEEQESGNPYGKINLI